MKNQLSKTFIILFALAIVIGMLPGGSALAGAGQGGHGKIVVANRGSGDISVIDAAPSAESVQEAIRSLASSLLDGSGERP